MAKRGTGGKNEILMVKMPFKHLMFANNCCIFAT